MKNVLLCLKYTLINVYISISVKAVSVEVTSQRFF